MDLSIDWSDWITAFATVASAAAACGMWRISENLYTLQVLTENAKKPLVHIWFDRRSEMFEGPFGELTFINLGREVLAIRTLEMFFGSNQITTINSSMSIDDSSFRQRHSDLLLKPNEIIKLYLQSPQQASQFKLQAMYYDNGFETLEIDTSILGGEYVLTGKGKKPSTLRKPMINPD